MTALASLAARLRSKFATLPARERRTLRWGAWIVLPVLVWLWAVKPFVARLTRAREAARVERAMLARERGILASGPMLPAVLSAAMRAVESVVPRLFVGPDDISTVAAVAFYVTTQARRANVSVRQVETGKIESIGDGLIALDVRLRGEGDLEGILTLLQALEAGDQLVHVREIAVEASGGGGVPVAMVVGAAGQRATSGDVEVLTFSAVIRGFAAARDSSGARGRSRK